MSTASDRPSSVLLADWTTLDARRAAERGEIVLLPFGALEQHGAHLPLATDSAIVERVCREAARSCTRVVVAPTLTWGFSPMHHGFPGTISLRPETCLALLRDVCSSLANEGLRHIVIVAAHGPNRNIAQVFMREYEAETGVRIVHVQYTDLAREAFQRLRSSSEGGEVHGGELETSLALHLFPELVGASGAARLLDPHEDLGTRSAGADIFAAGTAAVAYSLRDVAPDGVLGSPELASAKLGVEVFETVVAGLAAILEELAQAVDEERW